VLEQNPAEGESSNGVLRKPSGEAVTEMLSEVALFQFILF
jgi:hypothetical protein